MPISLITGPANAGKARLVMDSVRQAGARGREPLLVVPTGADAEYYLRELSGDGTAAGVRVERFAGLIEEAVRRAGAGGPRLRGDRPRSGPARTGRAKRRRASLGGIHPRPWRVVRRAADAPCLPG